MPLKELAIGAVIGARRKPDFHSLELEVVLAIVVVIFKSPAYPKLVIRSYSHITTIEECMYIRTEKTTIVDAMLSSLFYWPDMRCLNNWQGFLTCNRATSLVGVGDEHSECSLSQTRTHQYRLPIHALSFRLCCNVLHNGLALQDKRNCIPKCLT